MRDRVLVTGGAGFIGSHTVDLLLEQGYQVRILDSRQPRVHPQGKPDYVPKEAEFLQGDVANRDDLDRALRGVEYVLHLAAYQDYLPDFSTFIHVNTEYGTATFGRADPAVLPGPWSRLPGGAPSSVVLPAPTSRRRIADRCCRR